MNNKVPTRRLEATIAKERLIPKDQQSYSPSTHKKFSSPSLLQVPPQELIGNIQNLLPLSSNLTDHPDTDATYSKIFTQKKLQQSSLPSSPKNSLIKHNAPTKSIPKILVASSLEQDTLILPKNNPSSTKNVSLNSSLLRIDDKLPIENTHERSSLKLPVLPKTGVSSSKPELPKVLKNSMSSMPSSQSNLKAEYNKNKLSLHLSDNSSLSAILQNSRSLASNKTLSNTSITSKTRGLKSVMALNSSLHMRPECIPNNLEKIKYEVLREFRPHRGGQKGPSVDLENNFENNHHLDQILKQRNDVVNQFMEKFKTNQVSLIDSLPKKPKVRMPIKKKQQKANFQPNFSNYSEFNDWTRALCKENQAKQARAKKGLDKFSFE